MIAMIIRVISVPMLYLSVLLVLSACSTSPNASSTVANSTAGGNGAISAKSVNKNLVYESSLGSTTIKPHHTAVLNIPAINNGDGTGRHEVKYEILSVGYYKFCIPDDDSFVSKIVLYDKDKVEVGVWNKGGACNSKELQPGQYTLHVHHSTIGEDPMIFVKPHAVTRVAKVGKRIGKKSAYIINIPANQFVNQYVDNLNKIIVYNAGNGLSNEQWGIWALNDPSNNCSHTQYYGYPSFNSAPQSGTGPPSGPPISFVQYISSNELFNIVPSPQTSGAAHFSQGGLPLGLYSAGLDQAIVLRYNQNQEFYLNTGVNSSNFWLNAYEYRYFIESGQNGTGNPILQGWGNCGPVPLTVTVRYGTTTGTTLPAIMSNEVALFDSCYGANGFNGSANYWVISNMSNSNRWFHDNNNYSSIGMPDFYDFAFNNPSGKIKTIMAARGAQAQAYSTEVYQGNSVFVTPPIDKDMILTCTDSPQLDAGNVNSIQVSANTGDITDYEYEHHILLGAKTCVGCDLRGFKVQGSGSGYTSYNFSSSDLSNADFTGLKSTITSSIFINTLFLNANMSNVTFVDSILTNADFSGANLNNASFVVNNSMTWKIVNNSYKFFYNALPKFNNADLSRLRGSFDALFPISTDGRSYSPVSGDSNLVTGWWPNAQRVSMKNAKLPSTLFSNPKLWQFIDVPGVDFSNMVLNNAAFTGADLTGANFSGALLQNSSFVSASIYGVNFAGADLTGANLHGKNIAKMAIDNNTILANAHFSGANMSNSNLAGLNLTGTVWKPDTYTNWDGMQLDFPVTSLFNSYLYGTQLNGADLSNVNMQYVNWYGGNATGANAVLANTRLNYAVMPGLSLQNAQMQGADFSDAVLISAKMVSASSNSFKNTVFLKTDLRGADLSGANMVDALLYKAKISSNTKSESVWTLVMHGVPDTYVYEASSFTATILPFSTVGALSCPSGDVPDPSTGCGTTTLNPFWKAPADPTILDGCRLVNDPNDPNRDINGNVLICTGG